MTLLHNVQLTYLWLRKLERDSVLFVVDPSCLDFLSRAIGKDKGEITRGILVWVYSGNGTRSVDCCHLKQVHCLIVATLHGTAIATWNTFGKKSPRWKSLRWHSTVIFLDLVLVCNRWLWKLISCSNPRFDKHQKMWLPLLYSQSTNIQVVLRLMWWCAVCTIREQAATLSVQWLCFNMLKILSLNMMSGFHSNNRTYPLVEMSFFSSICFQRVKFCLSIGEGKGHFKFKTVIIELMIWEAERTCSVIDISTFLVHQSFATTLINGLAEMNWLLSI